MGRRPSAQTDTIPPSVPTGLADLATTINSFTLSWTASTDNVGVAAYEVFRDGASAGLVTALATSFAFTGLALNFSGCSVTPKVFLLMMAPIFLKTAPE